MDVIESTITNDTCDQPFATIDECDTAIRGLQDERDSQKPLIKQPVSPGFFNVVHQPSDNIVTKQLVREAFTVNRYEPTPPPKCKSLN
jgi:hypothetical protein